MHSAGAATPRIRAESVSTAIPAHMQAPHQKGCAPLIEARGITCCDDGSMTILGQRQRLPVHDLRGKLSQARLSHDCRIDCRAA